MLVFTYYVPIYFQKVNSVSALLSSVYMLVGIGPQIAMAITSGVISKFASPTQPALWTVWTITLDKDPKKKGFVSR